MTAMQQTNHDFISEVARAAVRQWHLIFNQLCIEVPASSMKHSPCPNCGGKDRFRCDDKEGRGTYICNQCGAGDGLDLVKKVNDCTILEAARMVAPLVGVSEGEPQTEAQKQKARRKNAAIELADQNSALKVVESKRARFRSLLKETIPLSHPTAGIGRCYFEGRGLDAVLPDLPNDWRFHPWLDYWSEVNSKWVSLGRYPALIGVIRGPDGKGCGLHRTYLDRSGRKLKLPDPATGEPLPAKKTMSLFPGAINGAAIRLYPAGESLAVAEGIETALAVRIATGLPVWATVSAGGMARLEVPEQVREIIIMADNDFSGTGEQAARDLAERLLQSNRVTKIVIPEEPNTDWVDVLNKKGDGHDQQ